MLPIEPQKASPTLRANAARVAIASLVLGACAALALAGGWPVTVALAVLVILAAALLPRAGREASPEAATAEHGTKRDAFVQVLREALTSDRPHPAVLMLEVEEFRRLEENYDGATILSALDHLGDRIRKIAANDGTVRHLGGPLFGICYCPKRRPALEKVVQLAQRLQHAVGEKVILPGAEIRVDSSIGFALPDRVEQPEAEMIMKAAMTALSEAQRNGPGAIRSYSPSLQRRLIERRVLVAEASRALSAGQITAHFQPQIDLETGALAGAECLCRWRHPDRGMVSPADFLPALRSAGLMPQLADCMIRNALDALVAWEADGIHVPRVGVNFSSDELLDPNLVSRIAMMLDERGLDPSRLVVEVLETVVAQTDSDTTARTLAALAELGCGIDLDDFGTGYAAITTIRRLSIGRIKIDRSFVSRIDLDVDQQDMVSAILTMAQSLGLQTLAEGVETTGEAETLRTLGCRFAQGFHFAVPMALEDFAAWCEAGRSDGHAPIPLPRRA